MTERPTHTPALAGLAALILTLGGAQPAAAASFDCARAHTAVEEMICGEWQLERLDERMATLFERAREAEGADRDALLAAQRAWLQTRDACTDTACLEQTYRERIAALGGGAAAKAGALEREVIDAGSAVRLADKRGDLEVEAVVPVLPGDDAGIRAANASIERAFREPLEEFRGQYGEFIEASGKIHVGPPWAFSLGYQGVHTTDTLVAVDGGGYMYTGGAHGGALYLPLVLDRQTAEQIKPAELFREDSDWLGVLSEQSRARLREVEPFSTDPDLVDDDWFQEGTAPTAENFGLLLPTAEGIRVTFTQYQIGPYAIGDFRVTVPYAALRAQLAPALFPDRVPEASPAGLPDGTPDETKAE
jgi:uncharacterized protein